MEELTNGPGPEEVLKKPQGTIRRKLMGFLILVILLAAGLTGLFVANEFTLEIRLTGDSDFLLEYGDSYQEPGNQIILRGKWLLREGMSPRDAVMDIQTDLRQDTLGKYTVSYTARYLGWQAAAQRTVRVVDTVCPVIMLRTSDKTVLPGQAYEEEGYIALDNHDGNLTDKVQRHEGLDKVIYTVRDSSGNPVSVEREIPYFDPLPPEILLTGGEWVSIPCGTIYQEPGFSASDNADGDMTADVAVEGEVIWYQPGTYPVVYTVADKFGNVAQKVRTVTVEGKDWPAVVWPNGKVIYLTFDDGPGADTLRLLDVLKHYGVKATFFVTGSGSQGELWRMYKEGHSIGIHTMTHDYESIYASEEAFFRDLYGVQDIIYRNTGIKTTLMRFPGGGSNLISKFNEGIMSRLSQAVQDAGFQYFDWNVDSNDAGGARRAETVVNNVTAGVQEQRVSVVLQHDIHSFSVDAVEDIIVWGLNNGYRFLPLTPDSPPMHHTVLN